MTNEERAEIVAEITTRDEAGRHFTEKFFMDDLRELEQAGLIEITRPVHKTGIPYAEEYWSVTVTEEGQALVDAWPECWPA